MELTKTAENKTENDAWLSLVERYVRDVEVAGSNPVTPTNEKESLNRIPFFMFFSSFSSSPAAGTRSPCR